VSLRAWLEVVTFMGDGDYDLRLSTAGQSANDYMICEIPDEDDVLNPALEKMVDAARSLLKSTVLLGHDPSRTGTVLRAPTYVEVGGQLFFSEAMVGSAPRPDKQGTVRAANWQIHPLLTVSALLKTPAMVSEPVRPEKTAAAHTAR
jgi:hypothetical protein